MNDLTVQLQDMFYNALGDEAESERVQDLIDQLVLFINKCYAYDHKGGEDEKDNSGNSDNSGGS